MKSVTLWGNVEDISKKRVTKCLSVNSHMRLMIRAE